jgi:hypothetical protein
MVDGVEQVVYTVSTKDSSLDQELMKKDEVSIEVTTEEPMYLKEKDYVVIDNIQYRINRDPESKLLSSKKNGYTITLESPIYTLIDKFLCDKLTGNTTITLTGKLKDFLELLVWNVNYDKDSNPLGVDTGWTVGLCPDTDYMNITFTTTKCRDALDTLANKFGLEYYVTGKAINYVKSIENATGLVFTQGQGNGLYDIEKSNIDSNDLITRVYTKGGTENVIPGEGDSDGRLILPEKYLENFSESKRVVEAVVQFDNIHPTFTGTVGTLSGTNNKSFTSPEMDFDLNDVAYGDGGERINFLTGDLMGKSFEFNWSSSEKKITLVSQEDTLAAIDTTTGKRPTIPSSSKYLRGGEKFNFTGIKLGQTYKTDAINKLRDKATDWLAYYCRKRVKFVLNVDYRYLREKNIALHCGDLVTVKAPTHSIDMLIRIIKIERNLYTGKVSCTVSNYLDERWEKRIEDQVTEIKSTIETSNGGKWGATSVTILTRDDIRTPTDDNLLSSARSYEDFVSKKDDDSVGGFIIFVKGLCSKVLSTFEKGIKVLGGIITDTLNVSDKATTKSLSVSDQAVIDKIVSSAFSSGQLGSGFTLYAKDGKSYMEIDELLVRVKAIFTSLEIRKLNYVGDNILLTSAGCKIGKVEETDTTYKCYFLADDGTTATTNDFVVGDQVRCQTFNIKAGKYTNVSNKYYWRLVTAVGDDYIELSKTDCDTNSDVPAAGDALVQLGNRTDTSRQNAMMFVVTGENAPSFIQYKSINSYSLSGKDQTMISPSGNKFTGSFYLSTGYSVLDYADNAANQAKKDAQGYADTVFDAIPGRITLAVSSAISNIQIGGRNLIRQSTIGGTQTVDNYGGNKAFYAFKKAGDNWRIQNWTVHVNGYYSFGFWAKASVSVTLEVDLCDQNTAYFSVTTEWQLFKIENAPVSAYLGDPYYGFIDLNPSADCTLYLGNIKLEQGSKCTDSSPAPEDVEAGISSLNSRVDSAEEKITSDAINMTVKSQTEAIAATAANSIGKFYVRGSGLNHNITPSVQLNGVEYASSYGRGHTLITINRSNLSKVELINYDTYGSSTYCDNLAAKLNSLSSDVIIVLVSFDACSIDNNLADALKNCGGSGKTFGADRIPYVFIGIQGIGAGNGIEVICGNGATDPYAEYSTIITGGIPQGVMGANCALNRMLSSFTIDTSGISLLGKKISLAGLVTFNSLDTDSQNRIINAGNAASNAQGTANNAQSNLDTLNGRLRGLAFTDKALDAMRNEGIIAGAYMNMAYLDVKTIVANGINAQTIDANNATFKNLNVENATLKNVQISGSIRSPFLWVDGNNVPAGGYTLTNNIALQGTNMTITSSLDKVGKRVTVSSVRYPNGNYIDGIYTIKASDGSPFYEDGIAKSQITISREIVELLGYGTETQFFGWIVLNRRNVYTAHKYGYQHLVMYEGFVNDDGSMYKYKSFDGQAVSSIQTGDGYYRVNIPSTPVNEYLVLLGNCSHISGAGRYASVYNRQPTYFEVYTGDDSTSNTGPFYFQVISTADWV